MPTSGESKESKAAKKKEWKRNTWSVIQVTCVLSYALNMETLSNLNNRSKIITTSVEMINIVNTSPDRDGKMFHAYVHKELLCFYSQYYTAALMGGFAEAKNDTVTLNLSYPQMRDLVSWLYTGTITACDEIYLMKLYVFADEKMMLALRRSIMSKIVRSLDLDCPMQAQEALPYLKSLPQNSGLFLYLLDHWAGVWSQTDSRFEMAACDSDKRIPRFFFYELLGKLGCMVQDGGPSIASLETACNFHEHLNHEEWNESMLPLRMHLPDLFLC
jgi:hypothetical protein